MHLIVDCSVQQPNLNLTLYRLRYSILERLKLLGCEL